MGLSDWLFGSTPGQQAGQAVKEVVTGVFDGIDQIIDSFHLDPDKALDAKIKFKELRLKTLDAYLADTQNARQMQMSTNSKWPGILSTVIILGFFGGGGYILVHGVNAGADELSKQIINMFAVQLMAGVSAVWGFWLGSSASSQNKDHMIYNSTPGKKAGE